MIQLLINLTHVHLLRVVCNVLGVLELGAAPATSPLLRLFVKARQTLGLIPSDA